MCGHLWEFRISISLILSKLWFSKSFFLELFRAFVKHVSNIIFLCFMLFSSVDLSGDCCLKAQSAVCQLNFPKLSQSTIFHKKTFNYPEQSPKRTQTKQKSQTWNIAFFYRHHKSKIHFQCRNKDRKPQENSQNEFIANLIKPITNLFQVYRMENQKFN